MSQSMSSSELEAKSREIIDNLKSGKVLKEEVSGKVIESLECLHKLLVKGNAAVAELKAGPGIYITNDVVSVKLAPNGGLQFKVDGLAITNQ